jgi:hypothetical protein
MASEVASIISERLTDITRYGTSVKVPAGLEQSRIKYIWQPTALHLNLLLGTFRQTVKKEMKMNSL